jgi:hypothetical protein
LHELFILDAGKGVLIARSDGVNRKKGEIVGGFSQIGQGYWTVSVNNKRYLRSRLIFCMVYGYLPRGVDHINRNSLDDRPVNLRTATQSQNRANSRDKLRKHPLPRGVWACRNRYQTRITVNYKPIHLGTYDTPEEAHEAYRQGLKKYFGEFSPYAIL